MRLRRFHDAQEGITERVKFITALNELRKGQKRTHWIWYILPQSKGLGKSDIAKKYELSSFSEACAYLEDPILFKRYFQIVTCIEQQLKTKSLRTLMSSDIDTKKTRSSLALFHKAALHLIRNDSPNKRNFALLRDTCDRILKKTDPHQKKSGNLQEAITRLDEYLENRKQEWGFHYNFFGLMSFIYWMNDLLCGTDYFNIKNKDTKVAAATKLRNTLNGSVPEENKLTPLEKSALKEGRLGIIVDQIGGDSILTADTSRKISPKM